MNFCPGCGSANLDTDAACRVCGRAFSEEAASPPVATAVRPSATADAPIVGDGAGTVIAESASPSQPSTPELPSRPSVMMPRPATGAATPSGFESTPATPRSGGAVPSFMRPEARSTAAQGVAESTSLISEHDLPDWIKQIAADDARKAAAALEADAGPTIPGSSLPQHLGRRALPGETVTGGPAGASWLNRRDAVSSAARSAWDATTPPPARAGEGGQVSSPIAFQPPVAAIETADGLPIPPTSPEVAPSAVEQPAKRRRRGAAKSGGGEAPSTAHTGVDTADVAPVSKPRRGPTAGWTGGFAGGDRGRLYLLAAVTVAVVFLLAVLVL